MIIVRAQLESAISSERNEQLCVVTITNDGSGDNRRGNYKVCLYSRGKSPRLVRSAEVKDFNRQNQPAWRLIQAAFEALG